MFTVILSADPLQLWSGSFGAALSAVLAAGVAVFVVWRSNKHQTKLSAIARAESFSESQKARREQRELLQKQLDEQRANDRSNAAIKSMSEYVASANELLSRAEGWTLDDLSMIGVRLHTAVTTTRILGGEFTDLADVMLRMSRAMKQLAGREFASRDEDTSGFGDLMWRELNLLVGAASALIPVWWNENADEREDTITRLEVKLLRALDVLSIVKEVVASAELEVRPPAS